MQSAEKQIIRISKLTVAEATVDAIVEIDSSAALHVTESMAQRILEVLPRLKDQICVSRGHERFSEEIVGTQMPHLLEHVAIELLVLEARLCDNCGHRERTDRVITGRTSWKSKVEPLRMCVSVTYDDDLVAMGALKEAEGLICRIFAEIEDDSNDLTIKKTIVKDIERITEELHALRMF